MYESADPIKRPLTHERITVRILMVIDGRVELNKDEGRFGLGFVIDTLRANWSRDVRIDLERASPMEFTARQSPWEMGVGVLRRISPLWGLCWVNELVSSQFDATSLYRMPQPRSDNHEPEWSRMPEDLANKAVLGCMANALYPLLSQLRSDRTRKPDVAADAGSIAKLAASGIANVPDVLKMTLTDAITSLTELRELLERDAPTSARS